MDTIENGGFDEVTGRQPFRTFAAGDQPSAFGLTHLDIPFDSLPLRLADERAHLNVGIQSVADFPTGDPVRHSRHQIVRYGLLNNRAAGCGAALSGRTE